MGESPLADVPLGNGLVAENLEWLNFTRYAEKLRAATVGLSLMLSPHTSYMPLEFAACGIPVVTSCYANKTAEALRAISPCLIGVKPAPQAIADGLEEAIRRAEQNRAEENAAKLAMPATWEEAFAPVRPALLHFMAAE
jgi:glycosyltransferase involved in cell wall biosynthesis